jgi:hypothetical protein
MFRSALWLPKLISVSDRRGLARESLYPANDLSVLGEDYAIRPFGYVRYPTKPAQLIEERSLSGESEDSL